MIHEYTLTPHSLYAAVSVGLTTESIVAVLSKLSKVALPPEIHRFIQDSTANYGKVRLRVIVLAGLRDTQTASSKAPAHPTRPWRRCVLRHFRSRARWQLVRAECSPSSLDQAQGNC